MYGKYAFWAVVLAVTLFGLKQFVNGRDCENTRKLNSQVVLVTGGSSGIGLETAKELARRGADVYITCRTEISGELAVEEIKRDTGKYVTPLILDLASLKSIYNFVDDFKQRESKLDILVNNAGVFYIGGQTEDGFEMTFGVNHLGHFLLTNLLMDVMASSSSGRIITVSSSYYEFVKAAEWGYVNTQETSDDLIQMYGKSKLANILFTKELARRLNGTNISAYTLHPGVIHTNILRHFLPGEPFIETMVYLFTWPFTKSPFAGAQTTICCATEDKNYLKSGQYYVNCLEENLNEVGNSTANARDLWDISLTLLNMQNYIHPMLNIQ